MRILLVDDDRTMRSILKTLLELEKYQVIVSEGSTSEQVITLARKERPDLIILDVHLKNVDGLEIVREMRQDLVLSTMKVLMTSGMDVREECLDAGADAFILKPYMPDDLISKIRQTGD